MVVLAPAGAGARSAGRRRAQRVGLSVQLINETVGNYRILELLGEGGMGAVYLAEHPGIGRKAAVKVLHPALAQDREIVNRFFNEARAANAIHHPGIVETFDFGTLASGATYIIMEFLAGESLSARLKRDGRLAAANAIELACQTADVLGAAHEQGIVHRDLKPDNMFLVPNPQRPGHEMVKVLDFGIAKLSQDFSGSGSVKTRTGTIMGTPVYMSPEQCRGTKEVDHRSDIYALGIILYEMLCGAPPFVSEGHGELIHMHIAVEPVPPRAHDPGIPQQLEDVVLRALAKDPAKRFQTMSELQQSLRDCLTRTIEPATHTTPFVDQPRSSSSTTSPTSESKPRHAPVQTTFSTSAGMIEGPAALPRRSRLLPTLLATGVAAAAVVVVVALTRSKNEAAQPTSQTSAAETSTPKNGTRGSEPAVALPTTTATGEVKETPKTISVAVTSEPTGARLVRERDGADIGVTPFKESWPASEGVEKLHIELDGYRSEPVVVPLDRGVALSFALTKLPAAPAHKKKAHEGAAKGTPTVTPPAVKSPPTSEPVPL